MKKYIASIVQIAGASILVIAASMVNTIFGVSLAGILLLLFGVALERRPN